MNFYRWLVHFCNNSVACDWLLYFIACNSIEPNTNTHNLPTTTNVMDPVTKISPKLLTTLEMSTYWICNFSIALIIICMATHKLWWTTWIRFLLSSSGKPEPCIILICLINVDFPDSPAPKVHDSHCYEFIT